MGNRPLILITNDDGIDASGISFLETVARKMGDTITVAPATEKSGVSHAITLHAPLRIEKRGETRFALRDGTPTDCVFAGVSHLSPRTPDLVLSGINHGLNLASDIVYSGTVAGAREGVLLGVPSVAISMDTGAEGWNPEPVLELLDGIIRRYLDDSRLHGALLNINIPYFTDCPPSVIETTVLGHRRFENSVDVRRDPRHKEYLWIGGNTAEMGCTPGTDCLAIQECRISVTAVAPYPQHCAEQDLLPKNWG